jgi:Asp-tRNA(Asn)/Glu-tRNA(Gln) amidotransferase A subunit family amidase
MSTLIDRRGFMSLCAALGLPRPVTDRIWADATLDAPEAARVALEPITKEQVAAAEAVLGLSFTDPEREMMLQSLNGALRSYEGLHALQLANGVVPALHFDPVPAGKVPVPQPVRRSAAPAARPLVRPVTEADWAFAGVATLSRLIHTRAVTSRQLVERCLARIERYNPELLCVVTPTRERALAQADQLDAEARAGKFRGPLHGIPYGAKDLFSVAGYPTTWGSPLYKDRVLDETAAVVERLDQAGAVLVAKTTLGEFAQGDVWFGGRTRNPWDTTRGSSGSSAGSASGVSAGLYPFALGTETLGSIVSPSSTCGVSGLRPTFGRVSRFGAMALSWSMDKVGPLARSAEDLAMVFSVLHGADPRDPASRSLPFAFDPSLPLSRIRIGVHQGLAEPGPADTLPPAGGRGGGRGGGGRGRAAYDAAKPVLDALKAQGATLVPVTWPDDPPANTLRFILEAEAAAAFEELTRNNQDDQMVQQTPGAWPNTFRYAQFIPAVQYIQANRARTLLMQRLDAFYRDVDVVIASTGGPLTATNLSGHPTVVVPTGFSDAGLPRAVTFVAALWREDLALRLAHAWQMASDVHQQRPPRFS